MLPFVHKSNIFPEETKLYISPDQDGHRPKRAYTRGQTCEKQDEEQMQAVVLGHIQPDRTQVLTSHELMEDQGQRRRRASADAAAG